jgi:hypothetical protein
MSHFVVPKEAELIGYGIRNVMIYIADTMKIVTSFSDWLDM